VLNELFDPLRVQFGCITTVASRFTADGDTVVVEAQGCDPGVARDVIRRRVYTEQHDNWLELMERLRNMGMSVAQMREYTAPVCEGGGSLKARHALLVAHRAQVMQTISEWTRSLALIDSKIDFYGEWVATGTRTAREPNLPQTAAKTRTRRTLER